MQMIGRDVEHNRHVRRETLRGGQLIGRHLRHIHIGRVCRNRADARVTDIAHGSRTHARRLKQMLGQRGCGGFAVRAGDGNPTAASRGFAPCELYFADGLVAYRCGRLVQLGELRDARACDAQLEMAAHRRSKLRHSVFAKRNVRAGASGLTREIVGRSPMGAAENGKRLYASPKLLYKIVRGVVPGFAQAEHKHAAKVRRSVFLRSNQFAICHVMPPPSKILRNTRRSRLQPARPKQSRSARRPSSPTSPSFRSGGAAAP